MTVGDVSAWLVRIGFAEFVDVFARHGIDGYRLSHMTPAEGRELVPNHGELLRIHFALLILCAEHLSFL